MGLVDCGACSERSEESLSWFAEPAPSRLEIASADFVSLAMTGEGALPRNRLRLLAMTPETRHSVNKVTALRSSANHQTP